MPPKASYNEYADKFIYIIREMKQIIDPLEDDMNYKE